LLSYPRFSLNEYIDLNKKLLKSGKSIQAINKIRTRYSNVKGGKLARLAKGKIINLILSDVVGDDKNVIASAPTTSKNSYDFILGSNTTALQAMHQKANQLGFLSEIHPNIKGNIVNVAKKIFRSLKNLNANKIYMWGGETTVKVKGKGKGGRNQELCLRLISKIKNQNIAFAAVSTDGIDNSQSAGALIDGTTFQASHCIESFINNNDSYNFFKRNGGHIITGRTGTNVCDLMVAMRYG
jgi:glycerate-2-kinase